MTSTGNNLGKLVLATGIFGAIVHAVPVWADSAAEISNLLNRAAQTNDPMPVNGVFKGEMAENVRNRTLVLLSLNEKKAMGIDPTVLAFANFRDHEHFYVAHIPGMQVDEKNEPTTASSIVNEVHVVQEHWAGKLRPQIAGMEAHTYLRFDFKPGNGVVLDFDQTALTPMSTHSKISPVVLSIEAVRPKSNPTADFMPYAFREDFAIGQLFYSKFDRELWERPDEPNKSEDSDWKLDLTRTSSQLTKISHSEEALLFQSVKDSAKFGRSQTYNFIIKNCTNLLFELLDAALIYINPFDRNIFESDVIEAVQLNIPQAIAFAQYAINSSLATKTGQTLTEKQQKELKELGAISEQKLSDELINGAKTSIDPAKYQTWVPAFVLPHLKARHLL